jgi:trigger factor
VERTLVSETLANAIERADVTPISEPDIDAESPVAGEAFRYTAQVEVKPEIELPEDLTAVQGRRPEVVVPESAIEAEIERIREHHVQLVEEDEGTEAATDHVLTLDFEGRIDGELFQGGTAQGVDLQLGTGTMVPGFEDQLIGVQSGEARQVTVTFPEDYGPAEISGQEAVFDCQVSAVRRRELPEVDDELAKDAGDFETLEALRSKIEADHRAEQERSSERALHESLVESLIALTDFQVPPGVVERQLQGQMRQMHQQFQGRVPDEVIQQQMQRMQEEGRPTAERRVREGFLIEKIVADQGLEASESEVDARLEEMAQAQGMEVDMLRTMAAQQGWLPAIEQELLEQKAYAWLAEQATIEDVSADAEEDSQTQA